MEKVNVNVNCCFAAATLACVFVVGLVAFAFLLQPVTDPLLFGNTVYTDVS